jgi:hypothetical protein
MFRDIVRILDSGVVNLRTKAGAIIAGKSWEELAHSDEPVIAVKGWVSLLMRERGKIVPGSRREGHKIWTNTGKEFLAMLMSYETGPSTPYRSDRNAYIGVGTGARVEEAGVLSLATPVAYATGLFLAPIDIPASFPLTPTRTTVRYHRAFADNEITLSPGTVYVTEIGLFTDGDPASSFTPGSQAPNAYKAFEPVGKTDALELDVSWEIRL